MAQVYSFVDENGATRLFAEIHPDPAGTPFNGGTITQPLTITAGDPVSAPLQLTVPASPQASAIDIGTTGNPDILDVYVDALGATIGIQTAAQTVGVGATGTGDDQNMLVGSTPGVHTAGVSGNGLLNTLNSGGGAPADGEIAPGQVFLWFDKTNGASKLMVKGKSTNGTVVAASIALA